MFLNVHSYYSLRYGTIPIEGLINRAKAMDLKKLALTDINNTTAIPDFVKAAKEAKITPIAGVDIRHKNHFLYVILARNNNGLSEINAFLSQYQLQHKKYPNLPEGLQDVFIIYPLNNSPKRKLKENEFIGIRPQEIHQLFASTAKKQLTQMVVLHSISFQDEAHYFLHQHLRAIDHNILFSRLKAEDLGHASDLFVHPHELYVIFEQYEQLLVNTERIYALCSIDFDFKSIKNKAHFTESIIDDRILLKKLSQDGFKYRYPQSDPAMIKRLDHELKIIHQLGFSAYFLITWDVIRYSMSRGFYHVGRGSGANSLVAYCLRITDVDPIELDLYFERFLNPKRSSPPDFDIDYSWKERDEVIDYIFKRYGREHTALLGTISTFKDKSIYRELAKVYGFPKEEIDRLVKYPEHELNQNKIVSKIQALANMMRGFPNMRSIHAGGILISEEPIYHYAALDMPPKGFPTVQWDMYVAEKLGFEKLDILSQRGIGHIKEAADIILQNRGITVDIHAIQEFKDDKVIKETLKSGETIGCFYVESPAMRQLLKKLKCSDYLSLVAASSIIRPGVARSGMMREYIQRFHHPNSFKYLHPIMEQQLKETYGVMVYQEDVLKVCHHFAGLDLADSDVLRRAMSGKFRSKKEFQKIVEKFFSNCKAKGYPDKLSQEVWRQIESFAGYSFSKAHSASYAVESYQSLFLKTYYPLEFITAVINNFGGYYHSWLYFNEARILGAQLQLPCVNHSHYKSRLVDKTLYIGFIHVQHLEKKVSFQIQQERNTNGNFHDMTDFTDRIAVGLEQLILLIKIGAFRFLNKPKSELLWEAHMLLHKHQLQIQQAKLFKTKTTHYQLPKFVHQHIEDAYDEIELIGFPVTLSFFDLLQSQYRSPVKGKELKQKLGQKIKILGQLVTIKYVKTVRKEYMNFGTFLDDSGRFFDTVHFPNSLKRYPFRGDGIYLILGKVVEEFGYASLEVEKMAKMPLKADPRA